MNYFWKELQDMIWRLDIITHEFWWPYIPMATNQPWTGALYTIWGSTGSRFRSYSSVVCFAQFLPRSSNILGRRAAESSIKIIKKRRNQNKKKPRSSSWTAAQAPKVKTTFSHLTTRFPARQMTSQAKIFQCRRERRVSPRRGRAPN